VGDLALEAQPKLLRALESGEILPIGATQATTVDVRLVAATHVSFDAALADGRFRRDLFARLAGVLVKTPPLAARREDILLLFRSFLGDQSARPMSADFAQALLLYSWPGNVRELRKLAERLLVLQGDAPRWELGMLDEELRRAPPVASPAPLGATSIRVAPSRAPACEGEIGPPPRDELIALLEKCDGNVSKVAEVVQRNRKQVYRWMDQWAIDRGTGRRS
jgi:DNA-binding NtrC family response regulator